MKRFLKYNEYFTLAIAVFIFFLSPYVLRWLDPTAAAFDAGALQAPVLGIVSFCILQFFVWVSLGVVWPHLKAYFEEAFIAHFMMLSPWQKVKTCLSLYLALFGFLVFLSKI